MSSSVTENYNNDNYGKLLVRIAENGRSYELECDENTTVEAVMQSIESIAGITLNDQLVLCLDMKLEPHRPLSAYELPAIEKEVFIYNKTRLQNNSAPPLPEEVDIIEIQDPPPPDSNRDRHSLDDSSDPALKALPSYERQFRYHYHKGHAIYSRTLLKYENCERLLNEQRVQERGVEVGRGNLDQYYRLIYQSYSEFMKRYRQQHRIHIDMLKNSGRDIEKLRSVKLHPGLQSSARKCLLDFVKEENLRKSMENCVNSHRQFENKVAQFQQMFAEVKGKVEEVFSCSLSRSIKSLEIAVEEHQCYIHEQKSIMQSLSKDVNTVKKLVDDCLTSQYSSSLRPHDAVSALGPMYDVHDKNHLPKMQACEQSISKLLDFAKDKKNEMNIFVHNYMQKVAYVSYIIKDAKLQFPVFKEAMARQEDFFADLKLVRKIGPAYRACLAEITRRKASMKLYMGMAGQLAEKLATKREHEVRRREEFLKTHGSYVPRDILSDMGLYDTPSQCDVNIVPFDTNLLDIDISDLDRYAPEHLLGPSSRLATSKGSFSDSSHATDSEVFAVDILEKDVSEGLLEDSELVEVAGTSKMEVENAKLKAELASAVAVICSFPPEIEFEALDDSKLDSLLKNAAEKTAVALRMKDEYEKHLHSMLKAKQVQCESYENRIRELELRLSDEYSHGQNVSNSKDISGLALLDEKADVSGSAGANRTHVSTTESMDEVSSISNSLDTKLGLLSKQPSKAREGVDENMMESSGVLSPQLDSSMMEPHRDELTISEKDGENKMAGELGLVTTNSCTSENIPSSQKAATEQSLDLKANELVLELQSALADKENQLSESEAKLNDVMEEVVMLKRELEMSKKLLEESQMNCAHLENCLHEAREEAQTHLCAADRRASEYNALRSSSVKMRGLFERLKSCVYAPGGVAGFADSLCALGQSLANSIGDNEEDSAVEFRKSIRVLADKVVFLSKHRDELLEKSPKLEATNEKLVKELEEKKELMKTLYTKLQFEKQANKEKISFGRLEVHELAAFVHNSSGHYEAINRNCSNCYLSAESVALFTDHLPNRPGYIVGQIVHIERQTVKPTDQTAADTGRLNLNSNPYGLGVGCVYFVVTIAMLPELINP